MTKSVPKIALSQSRDIPFDRLRLSQANVRHIKSGVSIEELAQDIARRTMLTALTVRPVLDDAGVETGHYEIPAGGRRFRALELLVKQKRLAKTTPIPCVVRTDGIAEEDSLAENIQRAPLHPLDQFRAFQAMRERGLSEEEIAAAFFVTPGVVKQRLRLAAVSPKLLDVYAEDGMTLEQLMAFTVVTDHRRQEQAWEAVSAGYTREPYAIRRMLTEGAVRASDKRVRFVGLDNYVEAGGTVLRDLFQADDGGWLQDAGLLDLLVAERLREEAETIRAEGWRWIETAPELPYGITYGLRAISGDRVDPTETETAAYEALLDEQERIEAEYADGDELPEAVETRLGEIDAGLAAYTARPVAYRDEDRAIAGAFVSIDADGRVRVQRGYVRPEDEPQIEPEPLPEVEAYVPVAQVTIDAADPLPELEEDEGLKPIPDRLVTELTSWRTLALREAVGADPDVAFTAALHALCLRVFFHYAQDSCLELDLKAAAFGGVPGLADSTAAQTIDTRHQGFAARLPRDPEQLWDTLVDLDQHIRAELFAHCVAQGLNAVAEPWNKRPRAIAHADRLASAVRLDVATRWRPTADSFLGRVTKARIVDAVREARGDVAAERIAGLKKPDMVARAEVLLDGTGWLPEPLRTPGMPLAAANDVDVPLPLEGEPDVVETAADGGEPAMADEDALADDGEAAFEPFAIAAE